MDRVVGGGAGAIPAVSVVWRWKALQICNYFFCFAMRIKS